ncbi:imidazole glycerol phosphate synthase subunit HisH [Haloferacaceae archaeon DSL9]
MKVTIIDYGVGNLRSLRRGLERAGATVEVTSEPERIRAADALVLPGVGAFEECMRNSRPFHDVLVEKAEDTPILGICVGFQLMFTDSEEGAPDGETIEGLDLISGTVRRLPSDEVKVPQMGWNTLTAVSDHPIVDGIDGSYAYFVHSYRSEVAEHTDATCDYAGPFAAIASDEAGNVVGTQFHPEKSGDTGLRVLANFVEFAESWNADRVSASTAE